MRRVKYIIPMLVFFIAGCAPYIEKTGKKIYEKDVRKIVLGVTEKDDIVRIFGQPSRVRSFEDGSQEWIYEYREKRSPSYFSGLVVDEKRAKESFRILRMVIDRKGKVVSYRFKTKEEE